MGVCVFMSTQVCVRGYLDIHACVGLWVCVMDKSQTTYLWISKVLASVYLDLSAASNNCYNFRSLLWSFKIHENVTVVLLSDAKELKK